MKIVLIKRSIEKDGLPKESGIYLTDIGYKGFDVGDGNPKWQSKGITILWYYEELPLSQLIQEVMPTEEERKKKKDELSEKYLLSWDSPTPEFRRLNEYHNEYNAWLKTKLTTTP